MTHRLNLRVYYEDTDLAGSVYRNAIVDGGGFRVGEDPPSAVSDITVCFGGEIHRVDHRSDSVLFELVARGELADAVAVHMLAVPRPHRDQRLL